MNSKNATHAAPQGASWQEMVECGCDTPDLCRRYGCASIYNQPMPRRHLTMASMLIFAIGLVAALVLGLSVSP